MREIIQSLVAAEAEAQRIVQSGQEEAERLLAEAEKRAQTILSTARSEARLEGERLVRAAVEESQESKRQQLQKARAEIQERVQLDAPTREALIQAVVGFVCSGPSERARE
jgi:vacuolar-type H+-ATPase subunit H